MDANLQIILTVIPSFILILTFVKDWRSELKRQELEEKKQQVEAAKLTREDLQSDYSRCRDELRDADLKIERLEQEGIRKSARIEQLEQFIHLLGKRIPEEGGRSENIR